MSVTSLTGVHYEAAAQVAQNLARGVAQNGSRPIVYNVNVPNAPLENLKGVRTTFLGPKAYLENVEEGHDGRRTHYWIRHNKPIGSDVPEGCDVWATQKGWISITPMDPVLMSGSCLSEFSKLVDETAAGMNLESG